MSTCEGEHNQTYIMREGWTSHRYGSLEDLFHKYKVDLYISSHVHAYERLFPTLYGKVIQYNYLNPKSYVHLMTGNAGVNNDMDYFTNHRYFSAIQLNGNVSYGYGILDIKNNNINWKQYDATTGFIVDEIDIVKDV